MAPFRPLVALALVFAPLPASAAEAPADRLGHDVVPTMQTIQLRLDADDSEYTGSVRIDLDVRQRTDTIRFHAEGMDLVKVVLSGGPTAATLTHTTADRTVTARASQPLEPGRYALEIDFHAKFQTNATGLYRMDYEEDGYAFTQFEPDDARTAFPCWDEPEFKIPFQLTVSTPEAHVAVSNTPVESETRKDGWITRTFQKTKPLPTYLLAVATGPLEFVPMPGLHVPGGIVTVKGQGHLTETAILMTPPLLTALEEWFGGPYPYEQLYLIAVPEYWPGAMEHPGAITFSDKILLLDSNDASATQKRTLSRIISHELAHMWFGDMVTLTWWDDLWLNEAFADWIGDRIADGVYPQYAIATWERHSAQRVMEMDARPSTAAIRHPVDTTENLLQDVGLSYNKGKTVLTMFENWIGPETFRKALHDYLKTHAWGNATAADLWAALDKASGKKVSDALAGFLEQPGFPLVTVEPLGGKQVRITQERFHTYGVTMEDRTWQTPVSLKYADAGGVRTETVLLTGKSQTVILPSDGAPQWIYPNGSGGGYYRWSAPPAMVVAMAGAADNALDAAERVEFLGNAAALLNAGTMDGESYLKVMNGFADDPEPIVVSALLDYIQAVQLAFVPRDLEDEFAVYMRRTLRPALERIGMEKQPGEDERVSILRPRLLTRLGIEGRDPEVQRFAQEKARAFLADPTSVDPAIVTACLSLAAQQGGRDFYEECRRRFEAAETPTDRQRYLTALGMSSDPALWEEGLAYTLTGPLRTNEIFTIPVGILTSEAGRERVFAWVLENYDAISKRLPSEFAAFMPTFASGCDRERMETARAFFTEPEHSPAGTERQLRRVSDQVADCVTLRDREGASVAKYMKQLAGSEE